MKENQMRERESSRVSVSFSLSVCLCLAMMQKGSSNVTYAGLGGLVRDCAPKEKVMMVLFRVSGIVFS